MLEIINNSIGESFVKSLLIRINKENVPYCLARGEGQLYPMSSDTDIILERKDYQFFLILIK